MVETSEAANNDLECAVKALSLPRVRQALEAGADAYSFAIDALLVTACPNSARDPA